MEVIYDDLLPSWLSAGMSYNDFWTYDFNEIKLILESWFNSKKQDMKDQISYLYLGAQMTAQFVGCSLSGKQPPAIETLFPNLFEEKIEDTEKALAFQMDLFKSYAEAFNEQNAIKNQDAIYFNSPSEEDTQ